MGPSEGRQQDSGYEVLKPAHYEGLNDASMGRSGSSLDESCVRIFVGKNGEVGVIAVFARFLRLQVA